jgi:hypothetical protein
MERTIDGRLKKLKDQHGFSTVIIPLTYGSGSHNGEHVTLVDLKSAASINGYDAAMAGRRRKGHWTDLAGGTVESLYNHLKL